MRTCLFVLFALVPVVVNAQQSLDVEVSVVEIEAVVETVKRVQLRFEGNQLEGSETVVSTQEAKRPAVLLKTSEAAKVDAFSTDFEVATVVEAGENRFLVTGSPGKYMCVVDTGDRNKFVPIIIPEFDQPDEPNEPDEPPAPGLESLAVSSSTLAGNVDDQPTRMALADALGADLEGDLTAMKATVQTAVEDVLLERRGESLKKDWLNGWRRPLSQEMVRLEVQTDDQYREAIRQIVVGLRKTAGAQSILKVKVGPDKKTPEKKPTVAPKKQPIPISMMLPQASVRLVPITVRRCGPFGVCREEIQWVEVIE